MTVETSERLVVYQGNAVATNFPYEFFIPTADTAAVNIQDFATGTILETLAVGTYALNGVGDPDGGSVDYPIDGSLPLDATKQIVIIRTVPFVQQTSISNQGGFLPRILERQLDLMEMQIQQIAEEQSRSLIVNPGQEVPDLDALANAEYWAIQSALSAAEAADYAAFAKHNWLSVDVSGNGVQTDWPLSLDPGTVNNIIIEVGGILQRPGSAYTLEYVLTVPTVRFTEPVPNGTNGYIRYGSAIIQDVNVPSDGSVTTVKIVNNAVTMAKLEDIATQTFLGRSTAGTGDPEALTITQAQSLLLPAGSLVDSKLIRYTSNAALATQIPLDDTLPQITEGVEVISTTFTMKSVTNLLRLRFQGSGANGVASPLIAAIFIAGDNNAKAAVYTTCAGANYEVVVACGVELTPAVLTSMTISVRVGPGAATTCRLNGDPGGRNLGGAMGAFLLIEEIKA